jgi:hypothetical protein
MGLGGFHIHVRVGLDTEYMGEEFMDNVKAGVDADPILGIHYTMTSAIFQVLD